MAGLGTKADNEKNSFVLVDGEVARRVTPTGTGNLLEGVIWDHISFTYPDTVTEIFTYKLGGSGGTTAATVTAVYTDADKNFLLTIDVVKV
jgi:hypothetical protein